METAANKSPKPIRPRLATLALAAMVALGCPREPQSPSPRPDPVTDSELCGAMCEHIGPKTAKNPNALDCYEGGPVYDSDVPGPKDVPNVSCEDFCKKQQANGSFLNPRCVMKAPTCAAIEDYRAMDCSEKK